MTPPNDSGHVEGMKRPTTIGGWCFAIYVVLRAIMDLLGAIDFVVERTKDPGWLSTVVRYLLEPPEWVPLLLGLIAIVLLLLPPTAKNGPKHSITRDFKLIAPLTLIIVSLFGLLIGVAWLIAAQDGSPQDSSATQNRAQWSAAKVETLENIFRILQDEMLPAYDRLGDEHASPWRKRILEIGPNEYVKELNTELKKSAQAVNKLSKLLETQAIYPDLVSEFKGGPEQQNAMVAAANAFQEAVRNLSDQPEERNLNLVEAQAEAFKSAVGAYGQWVRGRIKRAVELQQTVAPEPAGTRKGNRFIYDAPQLIYTLSVGPEDDGRTYRVRVDHAEPNAFVKFKIEYDGGIATAAIVPHEKQQVVWRHITRKTQYGVRLNDKKTTVLVVHAPPNTDLTIIRLSVLWWEKS